MNRCIAILLGLCALSITPAAHAEAGWTDHARVIELIPTAKHYYEIHLGVGKNPSGCRDKNWFYLDYDTPGAGKMFDLFVDNIQSKLRLRVYVTGLCNINGYSEISAVGASPNSR